MSCNCVKSVKCIYKQHETSGDDQSDAIIFFENEYSKKYFPRTYLTKLVNLATPQFQFLAACKITPRRHLQIKPQELQDSVSECCIGVCSAAHINYSNKKKLNHNSFEHTQETLHKEYFSIAYIVHTTVFWIKLPTPSAVAPFTNMD